MSCEPAAAAASAAATPAASLLPITAVDEDATREKASDTAAAETDLAPPRADTSGLVLAAGGVTAMPVSSAAMSSSSSLSLPASSAAAAAAAAIGHRHRPTTTLPIDTDEGELAAAASSESARRPSKRRRRLAPSEAASIVSESDSASDSASSTLPWTYASPDRFDTPYAEQLLAVCKSHEATVSPTGPQSASSRGAKKLLTQDIWLMLACTNQLSSLQMVRHPGSSRGSSPLRISDQLHAVSSLIYSLGARVDAQDSQGWSAVHWLVFSAMWLPVGSATATEEDIDLSGVARYNVEIEPTLMMMLAASERIGYANPCKHPQDVGSTDEDLLRDESDQSPAVQATKGNLLDLQDAAGNTPLHYAVHKRRVDVVSLLLCHGASASVANQDGTKAYDMLDWPDPKSRAVSTGPTPAAAAATQAAATRTTARRVDTRSDAGSGEDEIKSEGDDSTASVHSAASTSHVHPLIAKFDSSIAASTGSAVARHWGTMESLRLESCMYVGESCDGAVKRLLFQQLLLDAVEADPVGDEKMVRGLVTLWRRTYNSGTPMFPLAYRHDAFYVSPLQTAVAYETTDTSILQHLLKLPFAFHVQPRVTDHAPMHRAAMCHNYAAMRLLQRAGYNINHRDSATGQTPLLTVVSLEEPTDDMTESQLDDDVITIAKELCGAGADPTIPDDSGNDALTICVFLRRLALLQYLVSQITPDQVRQRLAATNKFGCTAMHYAFYRKLPLVDADVEILSYLISLGGRIEEPKNCCGRTPIQVWTGANSPLAEQVAKAMGRDLDEVKQMLVDQQQRKRVTEPGQGKVLDPDISRGLARPHLIPLRSEFETTDADRPQLTYIEEQKANEESQVIVDSRMHKSKEDQSLQEMVFRVRYNPTKFHPFTHLEVRMTARKGWGLFTTRAMPLESGIEVIGEVITHWQEEARTHRYWLHGHCPPLSKYRLYDRVRVYTIDHHQFGNASHFINHSCRPNLSCYNTDTRRQCVLFTNRHIHAGEELTVAYDFDRQPGATILCHCGQKECTGVIV